MKAAGGRRQEEQEMGAGRIQILLLVEFSNFILH